MNILSKILATMMIFGLFSNAQAATIKPSVDQFSVQQSETPASIKTLLSFGYPAHKIKWYRGGMQDWEVLGLSVVQ